MAKTTGKCILCGAALTTFRYKPMPEWNMQGLICGQCYTQKMTDHYIAPNRRDITKK